MHRFEIGWLLLAVRAVSTASAVRYLVRTEVWTARLARVFNFFSWLQKSGRSRSAVWTQFWLRA